MYRILALAVGGRRHDWSSVEPELHHVDYAFGNAPKALAYNSRYLAVALLLVAQVETEAVHAADMIAATCEKSVYFFGWPHVKPELHRITSRITVTMVSAAVDAAGSPNPARWGEW